MSARTPVSALPMPRHGLLIHRSTEGHATLLGPRPVVDAIADASGLDARDCTDDMLRAIDAEHEATLRHIAAFGNTASGTMPVTIAADAGQPIARNVPVPNNSI